MKRARRSTSSLPASARVWSGLLVLLLGTLAVLAAPPAWWAERSVLTTQPADDYAAANLGQLKAIASKAAAELNARLPGGAGPAVNALVASWSAAPAAGVTRDDYAALNLGQLKAVAQPFYDRLISEGYVTDYPWAGSPNPANDFALANLGQLKQVFRFGVFFGVGNDGDSLPDAYNFLNTPAANGGGLTDLQLYLQGRYPSSNNAPPRLPNGGNTVSSPVYGTANPGGGGNGPLTDPGHDGALPSTPYPATLSVSPKISMDAEGNFVVEDTTAHLEWDNHNFTEQAILIQRRASSGNWTTVSSVSPGTTEYNDNNGLLASVAYQYRLAITYANHQTLVSNSAEFHVPLFKGMSARTSWLSKDNPGFAEYLISDPPTLKHYLTKRTTATHSYSLPGGTEWSEGYFNQTIQIDPADGAESFAGFSRWQNERWLSDGSGYSYYRESTQQADGNWTGTWSNWERDSSGQVTTRGGPYLWAAYAGVIDSVEPGDDGATVTSTLQTYTDEYNDFTSELSDEYPAAQFFADALEQWPDYDEWEDYDYHYGYQYVGRWRYLTNDFLVVVKAQYKLKTNPSAPVPVRFYDLFVPDGPEEDPNNPPPPRVVGSHTFTGGAGVTESEVYEVDPSTQPDVFAPDGSTGNYFLLRGTELQASGTTPDNSAADGVTYALDLDPQQKSAGAAILKPADSNGHGRITGKIQLYGLDLPGSKYIFHFTNGSGFTVKDLWGNVLTDGEEITQEEIWNGASLEFTVTANGSASDGQQFTITLTTSDAYGSSFGTDSVVFTNRVAPNRDFTIPFEEASGSRYRKIGLNGRPLADEKPQQTAESDQEKEETYIDALTLGLRHSTTDVYLAVPGSDLAISARRDALSEVWNMRGGLRPHERFDRPFGAGWSSNLCVHLEVSFSDDLLTYCVTDQNGARHRFIRVYDSTANAWRYIPLPSDSRENGDYLTSLVGWTFTDGNWIGWTFTDRYGTKIIFDVDASFFQNIASDRHMHSGAEGHSYYRVSKIVDRHGNTLAYDYPANATTLIPSTIKLVLAQQPPVEAPTQKLSIEQDASGHILRIWDANGNRFDYGYGDKPYTFGAEQFTEKVLTSVTGPDGKVTQFDYDFAVEPDETPAAITNGQPTDKYHLDLKSITDQNGNTHRFGYAFDQTRWNYNTSAGYFKQTGAPRNVASVALPGNLGGANFANLSTVKLKTEHDPDGKLYLTDDSQRRVQVTDAGGNNITYKFGEGAGNSQVFNVGGLYAGTPPAAVPKVVFYQTMKIEYAGGSFEEFTFDPAAGLALKSIRDFSGNTTSYAYADAYTPPAAALYAKIFPYQDFSTKYQDPTSQTDALNQTKSFHYDHSKHHILDGLTDENGRYRSYQLDGAGRRLNEKVHAEGAASAVVQQTDFAYENGNFPGVVTRQTMKQLNGPAWSADLVTEYVLEANGRVWKEIVNPGGLALTTTSTYDRNGNKLSVTDPNGQATSFEYDKRNRLTDVVYADGSAKSIDYYPNGSKWRETDENGHATTFEYDALNRLTQQTRTVATGNIVTSFGYENAVKPKTSVTDPNGRASTLQYDGLQRLTSSTDALGQTTQFSYAGGNAGAHAFDSSGFKPTLITDPRGYQTAITYDALYRTQTKSVQYQLAPPLSATTTIQYDAVGNPTQTLDPLNRATTTQYDALNRPFHVTYADTRNVWMQYTATGLRWKVQDELGRETETRYDAAGRPVLTLGSAVDDGLNPEEADRTTHLRQPQSQTLYVGTNVAATINPLGQRWDFGYDVRNRKMQEQQPAVIDAATGVAARPTIYTGYDYVGNVLWVQDARGYTTETTYDEANRPVMVTAPPVLIYGAAAPVRPVTIRSYDRNGNALTVTDANGRVTINTYDWLNRLKTTKDAANMTVSYDYDEAGNRTKVTDGLGRFTTLSYDGLNRNTRSTDFTGKATALAYDGVNKMARTDALGQVAQYGYDLRHRLTSLTYPSRPADNRTYGYDFAGNLLAVAEPGKGGAADVAYTYDALRRVLTETSQGATHTYRYDLAGNRLGVQYGLAGGGNGRLVVSSYDALNRLSTMSEGGRTTSYAYDLNGNALGKTLPNGETVATAYDGLNRQFTQQGMSAQGMLYNYLSLCDPVGNLRLSVETTAGVPARTMLLGYDAADRLVSEKVFNADNVLTSATAYDYDAANNRKHKTLGTVTTTYNYNTLNQLINWSDTAGASASYGYDFNGNRATRTTGGQTDSYGYDVENRMVSLAKNTADGTGSYAYVYDYRTRRVARIENGVTTNLVFSGGTSVQEYTAGALAVDYVRGSDWGGGVGGVLYSLRAGSPSFAHYNRRGDVTARTNSAGVITYQASYEAGGKRTAEFGATLDRQKANTKEEDPTGLKNEGLRYTDLDTLTFTTRDPAGFVDGPNLYAYVRQNPWTKFDPEGLQTNDEDKPRSAPTATPTATPTNNPDVKSTPGGSAQQTQKQQKAQVEVLVGGAYDGHPYGHVAVRVKDGESVNIYDFGRYGAVRGAFSQEGDGILRVWSDGKAYIAGENATGRTTTGYTFDGTTEQAATVNKHFGAMTKDLKPFNVESNRQDFKLKTDYHATDYNCTTLSVDSVKSAFPNIDNNSTAFNKGNGLGMKERMAANIRGWPNRVFVPADLGNQLNSQAGQPGGPTSIMTYRKGR